MDEVQTGTVSESLRVEELHKFYGTAEVLCGVNLTLMPGQIHALVGHNGAGKSTLLRILSGSERADAGRIWIGGNEAKFESPHQATLAGIAIVHQELKVIPQLTIAQNIFLADERCWRGILERRQMHRIAADLLADFGLSEPPDLLVSELSHAKRQLVEVIGALRKNARYLLLDEPTSSLESEQIERLLVTLRRIIADRRVGILLVDHKIEEVLAVASEITVLVDGAVCLNSPASAVKREALVEAIAGQSIRNGKGATSPRGGSASGASAMDSRSEAPSVVLDARNVQTKHLRGVTLQVSEGEVVGIYGLVGSGRSRFCRTLIGEERLISGSLTLNRQPYDPHSPAASRKEGVLYLPEDRKELGLIPEMSATRNVALGILEQYHRGPLLSWGKIEQVARRQLEDLSTRGNLNGAVSILSGGNQQKVLFSRILLQPAKLLIFDEPTAGVDIAIKTELIGLIRQVAKQNRCGVIVVSSEEEEILAVSDRIAVFRDGQCDGTLYERSSLGVDDLRHLAWHNQ